MLVRDSFFGRVARSISLLQNSSLPISCSVGDGSRDERSTFLSDAGIESTSVPARRMNLSRRFRGRTVTPMHWVRSWRPREILPSGGLLLVLENERDRRVFR